MLDIIGKNGGYVFVAKNMHGGEMAHSEIDLGVSSSIQPDEGRACRMLYPKQYPSGVPS